MSNVVAHLCEVHGVVDCKTCTPAKAPVEPVKLQDQQAQEIAALKEQVEALTWKHNHAAQSYQAERGESAKLREGLGQAQGLADEARSTARTMEDQVDGLRGRLAFAQGYIFAKCGLPYPDQQMGSDPEVFHGKAVLDVIRRRGRQS